MNASEALGRLKGLRVPAATTSDVAAVLGLSTTSTTHLMRRLASSGLVTPVRRGVWALGERPDKLVLAEYVTAPYPSYFLPEKALVDFLYLSPTRGRLFASLPEVQLPRGFRRSVAREWVRRVPSLRLRTIVACRLDEVFAGAS